MSIITIGYKLLLSDHSVPIPVHTGEHPVHVVQVLIAWLVMAHQAQDGVRGLSQVI